MKILLLRDWLGPVKGEKESRQHKKGETISVLHWPGAKLLRAHGALWIEAEPGDPSWPNGAPPPVFRAMRPQVDKMLHGGLNK
jgi:hypothetical protein